VTGDTPSSGRLEKEQTPWMSRRRVTRLRRLQVVGVSKGAPFAAIAE
jgi:hypothetical protein